MNDWQLCFVEDSTWAYFANVPPKEMWGDDWNDAPHDCNAGQPYCREGQDFVMVAFHGPYEMCGTRREQTAIWGPGYLSAEELNDKRAPWLVDPGYGDTFPEPKRVIWAGTTLDEFKRLMAEAGGHVYECVTA